MQLHQIIERLAKVPRVQRIVLYGGAYVILVIAFWGLMYLPTTSSLENHQKKQKTLLTRQAEVERTVSNKAQYEQDLVDLMQDLKQALKELPNAREIDGLLKGLSTLGKKVGLEVTKFTPEPEEKKEFVAAVPVSIEVQGTYHEVAMFFDRVSKLNRIVYMENIEMDEAEEIGGKVKLTVSGRAVTFRFLSEDEIGASKGKGKRRKGKRGKRRGGKK